MGAELLSEVVLAVVMVAVPFLLGKAFSWWKQRIAKLEDENYSHAVEALEVGVLEAWEKLGKQMKAAHSDGKFDAEERAKLKDYAVSVAKQVAEERGLDVLKIIGARTVPLIIRKIVERRKTA